MVLDSSAVGSKEEGSIKEYYIVSVASPVRRREQDPTLRWGRELFRNVKQDHEPRKSWFRKDVYQMK